MAEGKGHLIVVGTGIQVGQITAEARDWIRQSEKVLYCVSDAATERYIQQLNNSAESLFVFYGDKKPRIDTYHEMIDRIMQSVRLGLTVCAVFYGHPGIFVYPSHESIRRARDEGCDAFMLPAVSSLDCLFADLGVDPVFGCQLIEATDLLIRRRRLDPAACVIIWQAGAVGDADFDFKGFDGRNIPVLRDALVEIYGEDFECVIYEAAQFAVCKPKIQPILLGDLKPSDFTGASTIFLPPKDVPVADVQTIRRLNLTLPQSLAGE